MKITRRSFLKVCGGTAAVTGLSNLGIPNIVEALEKALAGNPPVIWIQGAGCTGCSVSLLNTVDPDIATVLLKVISLKFHPTLMASAGEMALDKMYRVAEDYAGKFYMVVEGSIPTKERGGYCIIGERKGHEITMLEATIEMGRKAAAALAFGTCASFGGIPAAKPNPTGAKPVTAIFAENGIKTPVLNISGCPPHPDWMVGTIAYALTRGIPPVDGHGRPQLFYGSTIHENCPYLKHYEEGKFARSYGEEGCRLKLGCKGPETFADCWQRQWNNHVNWCVRNAICIGCVQPNFWDEMAPLYEQTTG